MVVAEEEAVEMETDSETASVVEIWEWEAVEIWEEEEAT